MTLFEWVLQLNDAGFAGHDDWRLPTLSELDSLRDLTTRFATINPAFRGSRCGVECQSIANPACSCTSLVRSYASTIEDELSVGPPETRASLWVVSFEEGQVWQQQRLINAFHARAVRNEGAATPTATPDPNRYVDNLDGTVTDPLAGLMWEKKVGLDSEVNAQNLHDADNRYPWHGECTLGSLCKTDEDCPLAEMCFAVDTQSSNGLTIFQWVQRLNDDGFAGFHDWRIPTVAELEGLRTIEGHAPERRIAPAFHALSCGPQCTNLGDSTCSCTSAPNFSSAPYFSSTAVPGLLGGAWAVEFGDGTSSPTGGGGPAFVRAVRSMNAGLGKNTLGR